MININNIIWLNDSFPLHAKCTQIAPIRTDDNNPTAMYIGNIAVIILPQNIGIYSFFSVSQHNRNCLFVKKGFIGQYRQGFVYIVPDLNLHCLQFICITLIY